MNDLEKNAAQNEASGDGKSIEAWLIGEALEASPPHVLVGRLAERLRAQGCPVDRIHVAYSLLHPLFEAEGLTWTPERGVEQEAYDYRDMGGGEEWLKSPLRYVIANRVSEMRRRLGDPDQRSDFSVLVDLASAGYADYLIMLQGFQAFTSYHAERDPETQASGMVASFATRRRDGFSEADLALIRGLREVFAVAVKVGVQNQVAHALAACYIGREAGQRVLEGLVHRGDGAQSPAVVLFVDMRDSTRLAETLERDRYIEMLNGFFDAVAHGIETMGGEIVAFVGDAALAIFSIERFGESEARACALRAVELGFQRVAEANAVRAPGAPEVRFGAALHAGDVSYGNIGAPDRLTWSVIGPVVNETARLQDLTKELGEPLLASGAFVGENGAGWRCIGERELRGVSRPMTIYAPVREEEGK